MRSPDPRGFTLVEVLVAATIAFTVLACGLLAYRTWVGSADRASAQIRIAEALPSVLVLVRDALGEGREAGEDLLAPDVTFRWEAEPAMTGRNLLTLHDPSVDPFAGEPRYGLFQLILYQVRLELAWHGGGPGRSRRFHYEELVWN